MLTFPNPNDSRNRVPTPTAPCGSSTGPGGCVSVIVLMVVMVAAM